MHPFGTSAEQSDARMPKAGNFIAPEAIVLLVLYFFAQLVFLIQVPSEVRHTC